MMGILYLIPNTLGDGISPKDCISDSYASIIGDIRYFIVEDIRSARRYLSKWKLNIPFDDCQFFTLNEHSSPEDCIHILDPIKSGHNMGVISEAGVPGVADPGALAVAEAHKLGIKVVPLVGPSSILLSMMASGLNGQNFAFNGYLPVKSDQRIERIKELERRSRKEHQTQLFIETPYRNMALYSDILKTCFPNTLLCIATDITLPSESICTKTIAQWQKCPVPDINKKPTVFLILSS